MIIEKKSILSLKEHWLNSSEDHNDNWRYTEKALQFFSPLPHWLQLLTAMTPEPWPLTSRQLQWLYSLSRKNTTKLSVLNLCEQNTVLYESTRARGRQNMHVTEHHGGESSTWLWNARQPQQYIQDEAFHSPHQRNARAECQTTAATLEMVRGGAESCKVTH